MSRMRLGTGRCAVECCREALDIQARPLPPPRRGRQRRGGVAVQHAADQQRGFGLSRGNAGHRRILAFFQYEP